ncbi:MULTISPECIES: fluoride efflux transporter FluC [Paenibacillus]|uniref:fluoride efflux transporter FluC n=1 Tax=Paenibacillus TaxID=44249 RepID=UPI0022B8E05F|nr:CrcB family protein [Paenibacillus caseinilyticus]MCZ8520258.1 CrcB family protein [Paenibacillus caseinilyticus]
MSNVYITLAYVGIGGFVGAVSRYGLTRFVSRFLSAWPLGTLIINVTGAFLLGILTGAHVSREAALLLGSGFAGAYTTFSTFQLESESLRSEGRGGAALLYLLLTYLLGGGAAFAGYILASPGLSF